MLARKHVPEEQNVPYGAIASVYRKGQTANAMAQQEATHRLPVVKLGVQMASADRPRCSQCRCGENVHTPHPTHSTAHCHI